MEGTNAMYILTDSEDDWTLAAMESIPANELTLVICESPDEETASGQPIDAVEYIRLKSRSRHYSHS